MTQSTSGAKRALTLMVVWGFLALLVFGAYVFFFKPQWSQDLMSKTGSESQYEHTLTLAADSFSGYSMLRSDMMRDELKAQSIKLTITNDNADYPARLEALQDGDVEMAVFTIDSLLIAGAQLNDFPGTIVAVIDESYGADAIVAYQSACPDINSLNESQTELVLTRDSPSETLARIVIGNMSVTVPTERWVSADGSEDVLARLAKADRYKKQAFVLWEPERSQALQIDGVVELFNSQRLNGYLFDVLVVNREFLTEHGDVVRQVVETMLRVNYHYANNHNELVELIQRDAETFGGKKLSRSQAEELSTTIRWKNTTENYGHFGLLNRQDSRGLTILEDVIGNISAVLVQTKGLDKDPLPGKETTLYYDGILRQLKDMGFHPARRVNLISGMESHVGTEQVRGAVELRTLSDAEWNSLNSVANLRVDPISFTRGSSRISIGGQRTLDSLKGQLDSFPTYYLKVVGQAANRGDADANLALAQQRARSAYEYLLSAGVPEERMKTFAELPKDTTGAAQSVLFVLAEQPY